MINLLAVVLWSRCVHTDVKYRILASHKQKPFLSQQSVLSCVSCCQSLCICTISTVPAGPCDSVSELVGS